jgi:DNA-binding protein Fis
MNDEKHIALVSAIEHADDGMIMHSIERALVEYVLQKFDNNQTASAKHLGINRGTFRAMMRRQGLL